MSDGIVAGGLSCIWDKVAYYASKSASRVSAQQLILKRSRLSRGAWFSKEVSD